ncbi:hypothetical protein RYD26_02000 [Pasteurellaceae bacterium LIM206]|nr:hypothetical protein [Pasteurellaceae bacterium LIM206]
MKPLLSLLSRLLGEFLYYAVAVTIPFFAALFDILHLAKIEEETSAIELSQSFFLLVIIILFVKLLRKMPEYKGGLALCAGFIATMFIREQDNHFDKIQHGSWFYAALIVTVFTLWYAYKHRQTVISGLTFFSEQKEYGTFLAGLLVTLVTSRLLGKTSLWEAILGEHYNNLAKVLAEEYTELVGYSLMLFAMLKLYRRLHQGYFS